MKFVKLNFQLKIILFYQEEMMIIVSYLILEKIKLLKKLNIMLQLKEFLLIKMKINLLQVEGQMIKKLNYGILKN